MEEDGPIEGFFPFETLDRTGRAISYYADSTDAGRAKEVDGKDKPALLAVSIQGSGCNSVFRRSPRGIGSGHQGRLRDAAG